MTVRQDQRTKSPAGPQRVLRRSSWLDLVRSAPPRPVCTGEMIMRISGQFENRLKVPRLRCGQCGSVDARMMRLIAPHSVLLGLPAELMVIDKTSKKVADKEETCQHVNLMRSPVGVARVPDRSKSYGLTCVCTAHHVKCMHSLCPPPHRSRTLVCMNQISDVVLLCTVVKF